MNIRIYLHDNVADILKVFGDLDELVDKILTAGINGVFDMENLPVSPKGGKVSRFDINVTNNDFLELRTLRGATSKSLSLRRMLYWFVDNEAWELINVEPVSDFIPKKKLKYITRAANIADELIKLKNDAPVEYQQTILSAMKLIRSILNETRD